MNFALPNCDIGHKLMHFGCVLGHLVHCFSCLTQSVLDITGLLAIREC